MNSYHKGLFQEQNRIFQQEISKIDDVFVQNSLISLKNQLNLLQRRMADLESALAKFQLDTAEHLRNQLSANMGDLA